MSLFLKEKLCFFFFNKDNINQKYGLDINNVVNDYSSWKRMLFKGINKLLCWLEKL